MAEQHVALVTFGMPRIVYDAPQRITEHRGRLFKRYPCLVRLLAAFRESHSNLIIALSSNSMTAGRPVDQGPGPAQVGSFDHHEQEGGPTLGSALRPAGGPAGGASLSPCFATARASLRAPSWPASCVRHRAPPQESGGPRGPPCTDV